LKNDWSKAAIQHFSDKYQHQDNLLENKYSRINIYQYLCRLQVDKENPLSLMRVTAVLTAKKDGSNALGRIIEGKITPAEPYLRNSAIHKNPEDNYVRDWINLANLQLLRSGAHFALDVENLRYVLEVNDEFNAYDCGSDTSAFVEFINKKAQEQIPDNPYRDSVILLFRWGGNPQEPAGQACSSGLSPYIMMNRYGESPLIMDGEPQGIGNSQLTHELGHFMSLDHVAPTLADDLGRIAYLEGRNPLGLPLTPENIPFFCKNAAILNPEGILINHQTCPLNDQTVSVSDLENAKKEATAKINEWGLKWTYDQDVGGNPGCNIPNEYGISDTPVDLCTGFPLIFGYKACTGSYSIKVDGKPEPFLVNEDIRLNIMSYWCCNPKLQRFSPQQVKRMEYSLKRNRSQLVGRTVYNTYCLRRIDSTILLRLYLFIFEPVIRIVWPKYRHSMEILQKIYPPFQPQKTDAVLAYVAGMEKAIPFGKTLFCNHHSNDPSLNKREKLS
jgi:hypothetical protein